MTGFLGYGAAHAGMHDADLLLMLGTDFPCSQPVPVHADVLATLQAVAPLVRRKDDRSFLTTWLAKHDKHDKHDKMIFTTDTGMCNVWTARYVNPNGRRRFIASMLHGSMADALPHATGAQVAHPGRQVVSISGDGGLSMMLSELLTVARYDLPVKIVLFDNSTLGMVEAEMLVDGLPDFGGDVAPVDYAGIARAAGFHTGRVEDPTRIRGALEEAFATDGPALVQLITDPLALSIPPAITGKQVRGFATALSKIVLTGGVGEAVQMARSNLRNVPRP